MFSSHSVSTLATKRISPDSVSRTANMNGRSTTTGTGGIGIDLVIITAAVTAAASVPSSFTMIRACIVSVALVRNSVSSSTASVTETAPRVPCTPPGEALR